MGPKRQPPRGVSEQGERPQEQRWRDLRGRSRLVALVLALSGIAAAAGTRAEGPGGEREAEGADKGESMSAPASSRSMSILSMSTAARSGVEGGGAH